MARSPISRLAAQFARLPLFLVTALVAMTLLAFCSRQASATIHYVSTTGTGNGSTWATAGPLQTIITAAHSGDQVWVKFGTYTGNFTATDGVAVYGHFAGTETSLSQRQLMNTAYTTILDGNNSGTVYTVPSSATGTNTLDGFTVENGMLSGGSGINDLSSDKLFVANCTITNNSSRGLYCGVATITNCVFTNNKGGGIYAAGATTIADCTFMENNAYTYSGGGVEANNVTITNCAFTNNSATYGGGIAGGSGTLSISISDCTFTSNTGSTAGGGFYGGGTSTTITNITGCVFEGNKSGNGAGIYFSLGAGTIANCTFTNNSASDAAGGIRVVDGSTPVITSCTFTENSPNAIGLDRSGSSATPVLIKDNLIFGAGTTSSDPDGIDMDKVYSGDTSYFTLANNTIVNTKVGINIDTASGDVAVANTILDGNGGGLDNTGAVPFTSSHNDVYGNTTYGYQGASLSSSDLTVDPLFVRNPNFSANPVDYGDLHLQSSSPLINAGDDSYVDDGDTDLAGNPRIYGSAVDIGAYEFYPAPTITSFTPTSGPVGTVITVTGTNLTNILSVRFHNANAVTYSANGAGTQLTVTVPSGAGTGTITVTTRGGTVKTATNFTVTSATPTITSFSPTSGPVGTVVTITGTNFTGATSVKFDGTAATTFTVVSATSITATVPTGAATGTISVTTPGGTGTSPNAFTVIPAPTITSFTPTSGPVGTVVTITGTNLKGTSAVRFHNASATVFSVNAAGTQLTVTVPTGAGTGTITVTTPGGSVKTATNFTVTASLPTVKTLTFSPTTIAPGGVSTGTVTLSGPAPTGGSLVSIAQGAFDVAMVTVASGQTTGTFTVTASASAPAGSYVFTASYNSSAATATLTVN